MPLRKRKEIQELLWEIKEFYGTVRRTKGEAGRDGKMIAEAGESINIVSLEEELEGYKKADGVAGFLGKYRRGKRADEKDETAGGEGEGLP